ncbi:MAG: hypothetical protein JO211_01050 [Acidobacteriaceae bacterium]|nr:hypothetical protein [Acidobacteriaceae bacterium]
MKRHGLLFLMTFAVAYAGQPWTKDSKLWSAGDAQRILADSPWAQPASASFAPVQSDEPPPPGPLPGAAQAGMSGSSVSTDGKWDGGVGKIPATGTPSLPITIRWESALPVREALLRLQGTGTTDNAAFTAAQAQRDYIITVIGLVPAGRYRSAGQIDTTSRSDDDGSSTEPYDPEHMLEGLMAESRLMPRGRKALAPEDVKLDAATGVLHLFFPRTQRIALNDKEVVFAARFGSMTIQRRFRLKSMTYKGTLEL